MTAHDLDRAARDMHETWRDALTSAPPFPRLPGWVDLSRAEQAAWRLLAAHHADELDEGERMAWVAGWAEAQAERPTGPRPAPPADPWADTDRQTT